MNGENYSIIECDKNYNTEGKDMKKLNLSLVTILTMSTFALAGGDIAPVEPVVETPYVEESTGAFYLGAAYSMINVEGDATNYSAELDYDGYMLQAGYKFNEYVAVEGRYWASLSDGDLTVGGITYNGSSDIDVDAWGLYVKPMYPVTEAFDIYALLGYSNVETNAAGNGFDDDSFSWGLGAAYSFTDNVAVFVDYVTLYDDEVTNVNNIIADYTADTWNFGVTYKF